MRNPRVLQLIMDSLRYWILEMHVDGFRFDLASTLARELHEVDKLGAFFDIVHQDPVVSQVQTDCRAVGFGRRGLPGRQLSRCCGPNGTASIAIASAISGKGMAASPRNSPRASAGRAICTNGAVAGRTPASTLSRATTVSRWPTWSATTTSTTKPIEKIIATVPITTSVGIVAPKDRPTIKRSSPCAPKSSAPSWPRCYYRRGCRCCWPATNQATRSAATTTLIARTMS